MKIITVLLAVYAVFSSAVHSQKVDPFASSSAVGTAKDDVSPINFNASSGTTTPNTEQHLQIKESIANGRELNDADCRKFVDGIAVDGTTLQQWCAPTNQNCCQGPDACINWSSFATYEVCKNSCNGEGACSGVANSAQSGATIKFDEGSCNGDRSCSDMAALATNLQTLVVGKNSCIESFSCKLAAKNAKYLKQLFIADEQCNSLGSCSDCGVSSTFDDTLKLTETCCAQAGNKDTDCNFFDLTSNQPSNEPSNLPSSIPSTSSIPSDQPSSLPSLMPSDIPSDSPSDQPSLLPSLVPSDIPSDSPSDQPSFVPSAQPSNLPSSEPTWVDDEQCKKKNPKNDTCTKLGGRCKIDCVEDENFDCIADLCSYNKKWNKPNKKLKLRELMNEEEIVEMEISAIGNTERKLKSPKAPKAPKPTCACRVPKNE